jgi:hypothetical protein
MADLAQLETALRNAHAAGDTQAARMLASEITRQRGVTAPTDPTEGMSDGQKFLAGAGKAFVDLGRGAGQLMREVLPEKASNAMGLPTTADIEESRRLDAPLMRTGAGTLGNVTGSVAAALPTVFIPGANTVGGAALLGAAQGALQPVGQNDSRLGNIGAGAAFGAAVPAAIKGVQVGKAALIDPITDAGRNRIVAKALRRASSNPEQAAQNLATRTATTPGFNPTAGQLADDAGIASLERTARAIQPSEFGEIDTAQQAALVNALRGVAGTPEQRAAAVAARDSATNALYRQAKNASIPVDAELGALMQRPSMQSAMGDAKLLAAERGQQMIQPEGPPSLTGEALHDIKLSLDTLFQDPTKGIVGAKRNAADATRREFLDLMDSRIPEYGQARRTFAEMSQPINQQDIGQELYNRFVPALADSTAVPFKSRADALAQALRSGDQLAQNVTGMSSATLEGSLSPEALNTVRGVVSDAAMRAQAQNAGRGVGSDTVQKMSMSNLINESGLPSWIGSVARVPGGYLKAAGNFMYGQSDDAMKNILAETLRDPARAAAALKDAGVPPSKIAEFLRIGSQGSAFALPGIIQGQQ